ncbi:MAG: RNA polymerase-associated protein RapA [Gammaproteobacteria bacterium]|nr:RNA polymerase-associated protein RapA [Gammaproteobacteria bacterium]
MGLGTVLKVDQRSVQIVFLATGETRTYAKASAPLSRVRFSRGDTVRSHDGWSLQIEAIEESDGLLIYLGRRADGGETLLPESQLDNFMQFSRPADRLFTGQIDKPKLYKLRRATRKQQAQLAQSPLFGLAGTRTSLIPHQLYIADEVSRRYAPRVLLADEVGLGKTIEAGLIIHRQLLTQRAQRVLIVVPESLQYQWLVEMLRRFNLYFSIFDEERCAALDEQGDQDNPFMSEQLIICSVSFLSAQPRRIEQAVAADWDLLVVDEAHHLQWSSEEVSSEYLCVERLAQVTKGVLLLTATPEQLGKSGHFARLRLLDPDRFADFERFVEEEKQYAPIATVVDNLFAETALTPDSLALLQATIDEGDNQAYLDVLNSEEATAEEQQHARSRLIQHLLDRHGTGRVLFRNTRHVIQGFPQRQLHACPLPLPADYAECLSQFQTLASREVHDLLSPERRYRDTQQTIQPGWTEIDPRVPWLHNLLQQIKPDKAVLICSNAQTALDLADHFRQRLGMLVAVFHEGMNIVERDRAAAFFASTEQGAQLIVCSEIGSEGRNFQFAHHLILFDLPLNPDLLEQRIGRLDRIGQTQTIQIHVPYLQDSAQAILFHWYHEGMNAFARTCPAGQSVYAQVRDSLHEALHQLDEGLADLPNLIRTTQALYQQYDTALQQGRDRLLEFNSCRPEQAARLVDEAILLSNEKALAQYLDAVFDNFGIESEIHSSTSLVIHPSEHLRASLPGLGEDGMTITYHRGTALANEDMQYLTWEHPMTLAAMDIVSSSEMGNTSLVSIKHKSLVPGTLLLECCYALESASTKQLNTARFLPMAEIRILIDQQGRRLESHLSEAWLAQAQQEIKRDIAMQVVKSQLSLLKSMLSATDKLVTAAVPELMTQASQNAGQEYQQEIDRLLALQKVNRNIRDAEIEHLRHERQSVLHQLGATVAQLDSLRVIVVIG